MNLFRIAIGACKLSIYGASYGTGIGAAFLSVFPEYSEKIVLDSPQPPLQDAPTWSYEQGETTQIFEDYKAYGQCCASVSFTHKRIECVTCSVPEEGWQM